MPLFKKQRTDSLLSEWFGNFFRCFLKKRFKSVVFQMNDAPFKAGDIVLTDFYPKEAEKSRAVTQCYRSLASQSGWLVNTSAQGKELKGLDSDWYRLADEQKAVKLP